MKRSSTLLASIVAMFLASSTTTLSPLAAHDIAGMARDAMVVQPTIMDTEALVALERREKERMKSILDTARARLTAAWKTSQFMAVALFGVLTAMLICAAVTGVVTKQVAYPFVFGGLGVGTLLLSAIWKPFDRLLSASQSLLRLDLVLAMVEQEWDSCSSIADPEKRVRCIRDANMMVLCELAKLERKPGDRRV
jgi:hypothetical protein